MILYFVNDLQYEQLLFFQQFWPQVSRQLSSIPLTLHRLIVSFLFTHPQSLVTFFPFHSNCNLDVASTHVAAEQLLHVEGHINFTPSKLHLQLVDLVATHSQLLVIICPSFNTLNRNGESTHDGVGGVGVGGVGVGGVGVGGVGVGAVGVGDVGAVGGLSSNASSHPLAQASCSLSFINSSSVGQPHLSEPQHLSFGSKKEIEIKRVWNSACSLEYEKLFCFDDLP